MCTRYTNGLGCTDNHLDEGETVFFDKGIMTEAAEVGVFRALLACPQRWEHANIREKPADYGREYVPVIDPPKYDARPTNVFR